MQVKRISMEELGPLLERQLCGGRARLPVTGSSMLPMLRGGRDVVELVSLSAPPKRGEVVLYRRADGTYVLHRVIARRDETTCLCCGDNQWMREPVPDANMIARVDGFIRRGRRIGVDAPGYRIYQTLWTAMMPLRRPILAVRRVLGFVKRRWRR